MERKFRVRVIFILLFIVYSLYTSSHLHLYNFELSLYIKIVTSIIMTPNSSSRRSEADTVKRTKFFTLWDCRDPDDTLQTIASREDIAIAKSTACRWLKERDIRGDEALQRQRK